MSMPVTRSEVSQYVMTSLTKQVENPLDALIANAAKRRDSPVYQDALAQFGPFVRELVQHLTSPVETRENKLKSLPNVGNSAPHRTCDWAVHSAIALAVLVRFDCYIQDELERRNYRRTHDNPTGMDLLEAIGIRTQLCDANGLVVLIENEASCFLGFVEDSAALEASIRDRLGDFKKLTDHAGTRSIAGRVRTT